MFATQQYPWFQRTTAAGKKWPEGMDESMATARQAGYDAWEPVFNDPDDVRPVRERAAHHGLAIPSFYAGAVFHDAGTVNREVERVLRVATEARTLGATICVINPNPIAWGSAVNKTDAQLVTQANALQRLGQRFREQLGISLAYHTHSPEMRAGARELHHMLLATDPADVKFCLDTHWIYRGAENSQIAMLDILKLYADRIVELHLRQSHNGTWSETFDAVGDIDYAQVARLLRDRDIDPLFVLEQAIENGTPSTLPPVEANRRSLEAARRVFGS